MFTLKKNINISVFFDGPKDNPAWPSESVANKKPSEATETVDKTKLDALTKEMLEEFLWGKNRSEATELLKKYKEKLKRENINPKLLEILEQRERTLIIWSNFNGILFGSSPDGEKKEVSKDHQSALTIALGISWKEVTFPQKTESSKLETIVKETQKTEDPKLNEFLNNNPIDTYKSKWIEACLKHPQQIKDNLMGQGARRLWGNVANSLQDELRILQELWKELPVEYKTLIGTLINVTKSLEFWRYTWFFSEWMQKSIWRDANMEEFQKNFRNFMDVSIKERKTLTKEDFDNFFNKKREPTPEENEYINKKYDDIYEELKSINGKDEKLKKLADEIKTNWDSLHSAVVTEKLHLKLQALYSYLVKAPEDSISTFFRKHFQWSNNTPEGWGAAQEKANKMNNDWEIYFIDFNEAKNDFDYVSSTNIAKEFLKDNLWNIEKTMFQSLIKGPKWQQFFKNAIGEDGIAAVGAYINSNHETVLLKSLPPDEAESVKGFFIDVYNKTAIAQEELIRMEQGKFSWMAFEDLFPSLKDNSKITPEMQAELMKWNAKEFYNLLAKTENGGSIHKIMDDVADDTKSLKERLKQETLESSTEFKGKKVDEYKNLFNLDTPEKEKKFQEIKDKTLVNGRLTPEDIRFLLSVSKDKTSSLYKHLEKSIRVNIAANMHGQVQQLYNISGKLPQDRPVSELDKNQEMCVMNAGAVSEAIAEQEKNIELWVQNSGVPWLGWYRERTSIIRELNRMNTLDNLSDIDKEKISILKSRLHDDDRSVIAIANYTQSPGVSKEDAIGFMREITNSNASDEEMQRWIESKQFTSKYVVEKKFIDDVEKNAAYMNWEPRSIHDIYGGEWKAWGIKLSESDIMGLNTSQWMSTLMNCSIEICDDNHFTRTIKNPDGEIIAKDIPLQNIKSTIQQLGRFYSGWLGKLAPYMQQVWNAINSTRPDHITGLDGTYNGTEDIKFLKIFAITLYGENSLPEDLSIPNLLKLFNKPNHENSPEFKLKQLGILKESGWINSEILEKQLQAASKKVS